MKWKRLITGTLCIMLILTTGCQSTPGRNFSETKVEPSLEPIAEIQYPKGIAFNDYEEKRRVRENNPLYSEYLEVLDGFATRTAVELLNQEKTSNIMYSPISLYMALALTASGANNQTQDEILRVLGMEGQGIHQLQEQTGNLFRLLYTDNEISKLLIAQSLWVDKNISLKDKYIDTVTQHYYSSIFNVDFKDENTGELIAQWISENTNGTLKPLNPVNENQIMSIINTIYFYDEWTNKFNEKATKKDEFYTHDGKQVEVDFMNTKYLGSFVEGDGYISTSLGFKNQGSMNFYLPNEGVDLYQLISTPEKLAVLLNIGHQSKESKYGEVHLKVPKFKFGTNLQVKESLQKLGIEKAFEARAEFSNLTDEATIYISEVIQSTYISINENGCEASAYTNIVMLGSALPRDNAEIVLDRPFIFTITASNGAILFMGIVNNPTIQ